MADPVQGGKSIPEVGGGGGVRGEGVRYEGGELRGVRVCSILCGSMAYISSDSRRIQLVRQGRFAYEGVVGIKQTHIAGCCENLNIIE